MKDLMKSKKVIGKIPCTKQPYSIIQFLALSLLCCFFCSGFTDADYMLLSCHIRILE